MVYPLDTLSTSPTALYIIIREPRDGPPVKGPGPFQLGPLYFLKLYKQERLAYGDLGIQRRQD